MNASDDQQEDNGGGLDQAPAVVLPLPNAQGVGGQPSGFASGAIISPPPVVGDGSAAAGADTNLVSRIEQTLAEDGRFSAFAAGLIITTDNDGTVHLAGPVPSEDRRRSLLATLHSLPGVTAVTDGLAVG